MLALLLYTGQRRSDVVQFGPQHVKDSWITLTQARYRVRKPVTLSIPVLRELQAVVDQTSVGSLAILVPAFSKPFSPDEF